MKKQLHTDTQVSEVKTKNRGLIRLHQVIWQEMSNQLAVYWALISNKELEIVYANLRV